VAVEWRVRDARRVEGVPFEAEKGKRVQTSSRVKEAEKDKKLYASRVSFLLAPTAIAND